jgi:2-dehydro-3-deoxygluconokinase
VHRISSYHVPRHSSYSSGHAVPILADAAWAGRAVIYDLIALGETMATFCPPAGTPLSDASSLVVDHGGAESNACVGLSRLGFHVAWISKLGADPLGDRVLETLKHEGIDTRWVVRDESHPTGIMVKDPVNRRVHYYRAGSAASTLCPKDLDGVPVREARAVMVTGITALIGADPQLAAIALLEAGQGLRVVDPNLRHGLWGSARRAELVLPLIERADLVLAGDHELAEILGPAEPEELARRCARAGPREVVVRCDHKVGAWRADGGWTELSIQTEQTPDPMGAGDAFDAGYIAGCLRGKGVEDALRFAILCGRAVATSAGDTAGFPHHM